MLMFNFINKTGMEMKDFYENMPQPEYRAAEGLANSELQLFSLDPASYIWAKTAPQDPAKVTAKDMGTALHTKILEPEKFDNEILISSFKGRTAQGFEKEVTENQSKTVLTEIEAKQIDIMALSAMAHPQFKQLINATGFNECSIFVDDVERGIKRKIRLDKLIQIGDNWLPLDLKKTADISKWRQPVEREWLNPLHDMNYGYTAAYYLDTLSLWSGVEVNEYVFPIIQSSASLGRYPVSVFSVTRQELVDWGFWQKVQSDLDKFAKCHHSNNFMSFERFKTIGAN